MFNHVHGHSHISGFLRIYMCKTIFLAGKYNGCELCSTGMSHLTGSSGEALQPIFPEDESNTKRFRTTTPKPDKNWLHKNSTIISTNTLIFHGLGGSSGCSAVADVSQLSPAKDGTHFPKGGKPVSMHKGLELQMYIFLCSRWIGMSRNMGVRLFQGFCRLIHNPPCIDSDSCTCVDGHVYWDLGKLTVLFCKTFACITRMLDLTLGKAMVISVSLITFWWTFCRECANIYDLFQKILVPFAMMMSRF